MSRKWTTGDIPSQAGRIAIVTGANTGLGFQTARALAAKNATVILACRNQAKGQAAVRRIIEETPTARCETMPLDLSDLASVQRFAERFQAKYDGLDLLINNAGVMMPPYAKTRDGFELQFGINHLGHFALTGRLLDRLKAAAGSRVVTVSSNGHAIGDLDFDDLDWDKRRYARLTAYGDSKLANLTFTYELDRRLRASGIPVAAVAAHPGFARTELPRNFWFFRLLSPILAQSPRMGALPQLYAATAEAVESGQYFGPRSIGGLGGYPRLSHSNKRSHDRANAARLFEISEALTGVGYAF